MAPVYLYPSQVSLNSIVIWPCDIELDENREVTGNYILDDASTFYLILNLITESCLTRGGVSQTLKVELVDALKPGVRLTASNLRDHITL